ncbi:TRAP transporter TatT component family protein [Rhodoferax sp. GW822-FHT02A01]|uniref:TRAP transporter TatT component family protein n=1 Tax=Rhodoferax sp. GW822-FHT02A01 TaxID=3141537 RepID=UPI00315D7C64
MLGTSCLLLGLAACSPKHLIVQGIADELATQGQAPEDDLVLAREASAFYLKLSEGLLREVPDNAKLAESLATGFTQYAYAFVAFDAERLEARDAKAAQALRERAARLYGRAHRHAMAALERMNPGFRKALQSNQPADWPQLRADQIGLAYWAAASWGGLISLSKDQPDTVADLPLAMRLARLAYDKEPGYGNGSLAGLMGSFEVARPGGSSAQALQYFDSAIALSAQRSAGPLVAKAESIALPAGNRPEFEALLQQALAVSAAHPDLQNTVMRERALWLLGTADDLF